MPAASLLVLALILSVPAVASNSADASRESTSSTSDQASVPTADVTQSFEVSAPRGAQDDIVAPADDVCYRIRAYIFKRDDDHAPEFVRSTTCGPRRPHTKGIAWPKAKLVPAK